MVKTGQNWQIDPSSGDYVMDKGAPIQTDSLTIPAYFRLKVRQGEWLYAPNPQYGSSFHKIKKKKSTKDASLIENTAAVALQPIADDNRAESIDIETKVVKRGAVGIEVTIFDKNNGEEKLLLPQI